MLTIKFFSQVCPLGNLDFIKLPVEPEMNKGILHIRFIEAMSERNQQILLGIYKMNLL